MPWAPKPFFRTQRGGFGQCPGAGGGSSLPWLAGGFWSRLSFQAMPSGCHMPRGPERSCLCPTAHVSPPGTQSSGVHLRPPIPARAGLPRRGAAWGLLFFVVYVSLRERVYPQLSGESTSMELGLCSSVSILTPTSRAVSCILRFSEQTIVSFFGSSSS